MKSLTPIILIAVSILLFFFHLEPEYQRLAALQEEGAVFENLLNQADELREVRESLRVKQEEFNDQDIRRLETLIPDEFNLVNFVHDLDGVASRHNIIVENINHSQEASSDPNLNRAVISFSFATSHSNFLRFLEDIENSLRIINVTSLQIRTPSDENNVHNYNLTMETYWIN